MLLLCEIQNYDIESEHWSIMTLPPICVVKSELNVQVSEWGLGMEEDGSGGAQRSIKLASRDGLGTFSWLRADVEKRYTLNMK